MPTEQPSIEDRLSNYFEPPAIPTEQETPDVEETSEIEVEEQASAEPETEVEESPEEPETETEDNFQFQSLDELAEALEMPMEDFMGQIKGKIKVNGQEQELTLAELIKGNQFEADYRQKTAAVAEKNRQLEEQRQELQNQYTQRLQEAGVIITQLEENLLSDFQGINWNDLKAEDENQYLMKRQEYQDRKQMIDTVKSQANQKAQELIQEQQELTRQQETEYLRHQGALLLQKLPEWADGDKSRAEWSSITSYLAKEGFTSDEIGHMQDHRAILLARKAMLYDKGMQNVDVTKKKVKNLPKIQKPGARQSASAAKGKQVSTLRQKLKKSGDVKDAAKLIEKLL